MKKIIPIYCKICGKHCPNSFQVAKIIQEKPKSCSTYNDYYCENHRPNNKENVHFAIYLTSTKTQ